MRDGDLAFGIFTLIMVALTIVCASTLTQDNTHINLEAITTMTSKCDSNGGLSYIEHDYDVVCKNGAEFEHDRSSDGSKQ